MSDTDPPRSRSFFPPARALASGILTVAISIGSAGIAFYASTQVQAERVARLQRDVESHEREGHQAHALAMARLEAAIQVLQTKVDDFAARCYLPAQRGGRAAQR